LHVFGEVAIVKGSNKIQGKLKNKGLPLLYCGIARDHAADCFTFLNTKTKKYVESRDVNLWFNQTYGEYEGLSPPSQLSTVVHVPLADNAYGLRPSLQPATIHNENIVQNTMQNTGRQPT